MSLKPYERILLEESRAKLKPCGIAQRGRSRLWLDDHWWWTIAIEFQPGKWGGGTFLNIGVDFNWSQRDYFAFLLGAGDSGARVSDFLEYVTDDQFREAVSGLINLIIEKVALFRKHFSDRDLVKSYISDLPEHTLSMYDRANLSAILGEPGNCQELLLREEARAEQEGLGEYRNRVLELLDRMRIGHEHYITELKKDIQMVRTLKKLPEVEREFWS